MPLKTATGDKRKESPPKDRRKTEESKKQKKEEGEDGRGGLMAELPVAAASPAASPDAEDVVHLDDDDDEDVDGDFDPSDYLESVVSFSLS